MKLKFSNWISAVAIVAFAGNSYAQESPKYEYTEAFKPFFYTQTGTPTRSASGQPGYAYWQNSASYNLNVSLNDAKNEITGTAEITYTNNSTDRLSFLWLQLDQNLFAKDSRGNAVVPVSGSRNGAHGEEFDGGYRIKSVKLDGKEVKYTITDTRMQIDLPSELKAQGGVAKIKIEYSFLSPKYGSDRMGIEDTKNGKIYTIAQWYPRMCVYDDVLGWNTMPYLGASEFYLEYGDITANITVPASHYVVASGELLNPKEVYSREENSRWEQAGKSDKTVMIRTESEIGKTSRPERKPGSLKLSRPGILRGLPHRRLSWMPRESIFLTVKNLWPFQLILQKVQETRHGEGLPNIPKRRSNIIPQNGIRIPILRQPTLPAMRVEWNIRESYSAT